MAINFPYTLLNPALYPHSVQAFKVIETHLSWVILTGCYAYKIKKPLNLRFQDFTTLEKRKYYCELELKLNQRTAPQLYLEVIAITGSPAHPEFNGQGEVFEYAIKMKEFPQSALLSYLAKQNDIASSTIKTLGKNIGEFHLNIEICPPSYDFGQPNVVFHPIAENFKQLKESLDPEVLKTVQIVEDWHQKQFEKLKSLCQYRKDNGFIRACHGDLHLGNIVLLEKPIIFDCIEFNESFRWIDVYNDIAFLCMDLAHYKLQNLSSILLNTYLEETLDYSGLPLLRFYQCYRAMVRAKIMYLQLQQHPNTTLFQKELENFLNLAISFTQYTQPKLIITHGLSGSGKSIYTEQLLSDANTIRIRSDVIRIKQFYKAQRYSPETSQAIYAHLKDLSKILLQSGFNVIVDATFLRAEYRRAFFALAEQLNCAIEVLAFEASDAVLKSRIQQRLQAKQDISEADAQVLDLQKKQLEPLTNEEKKYTTVINESLVSLLISKGV